MAECARYDREVDEGQKVTPNVITEEGHDSADHGRKGLAGREGDMEVCVECVGELRGG